jgi:hypothetical protein
MIVPLTQQNRPTGLDTHSGRGLPIFAVVGRVTVAGAGSRRPNLKTLPRQDQV